MARQTKGRDTAKNSGLGYQLIIGRCAKSWCGDWYSEPEDLHLEAYLLELKTRVSWKKENMAYNRGIGNTIDYIKHRVQSIFLSSRV